MSKNKLISILILLIFFNTSILLAKAVHQLPDTFSGEVITYSFSKKELFNNRDIEIKNILISCPCIKLDNSIDWININDKIVLVYDTNGLIGDFNYTLSIFYKYKDEKQTDEVSKRIIHLKSFVKNNIEIIPSKIIINPMAEENYFQISLKSKNKMPFSILNIENNENKIKLNYSNKISLQNEININILEPDNILFSNQIEILIDWGEKKETIYFIIEKSKIVEPNYLVFNGIDYDKEYLRPLKLYGIENINNLQLSTPTPIFKLIKIDDQYNISLILPIVQDVNILKGNLYLEYNSKNIKLPYIIFPKREEKNKKKDDINHADNTQKINNMSSGIIVSNLDPSFSQLLQGHAVILKETIKNIGNEQYEILIRTTCSSCGGASIDKNILNPNETAKLSLKVISSNPENYKKDIWIYEKQGKFVPVKMTISGIVKKAYDIKENWIDNKTLEIEIIGLHDFDKAIMANNVKCFSKIFDLQNVDFRHSTKGKFYVQLLLKLKDNILLKNIQDWISFNFDNILILNHKVERNVL